MNSFMDIGSSRHGDAYLAKLDGTGQVIWEQAYSDGRWLSISSIALRTAGGALVAGSASTVDTSWLARVGPDGARLQEWRLGNGKGIGVVALQDGRTLIAGFADGGMSAGAGSHRDAALAAVKAGTYRDDVVVWTLGEAGQPQGPASIREGISQSSVTRGPGGGGGSIAMAVAANAAYVATNWLDVLRPAGVEVARIEPDGRVAWRRSLPETVAPVDEKRACQPTSGTGPSAFSVQGGCSMGGR